MTDSLRDQLLGLGFKPVPKPAPSKLEGRERPSNSPRADARGGKRTDGRSTPANGARPEVKPPGGPQRGRAEMDLAKAYAIRAQKEKDERIAAEQARQEEARLRREGKLKLAELLASSTLNDPAAEIARHFEYGGKIRRVYVTADQLKALNKGELAVVQQGGRYHVLAPERAHAANELLPGVLALLVDPSAPSKDDVYADPQYQVPDDLVW